MTAFPGTIKAELVECSAIRASARRRDRATLGPQPMNPPFLITLSLIAAGAFTMWCAFRNYRWFFETGWQGYLLNRYASRNFARLLYFMIGLLVMAVGGARLVHPPRVIPDDFLFELARPDGIDLIAPREAATRLAAAPRRNLELRTDDQGWVSFWRVIDPSEPFFQDAAEVR